MAPLHLVGGTRSLFFLTRGFLGVSLIHFVVSLLSQLNRFWAWLANTPMPQPLSVFGCVVKANLTLFTGRLFPVRLANPLIGGRGL